MLYSLNHVSEDRLLVLLRIDSHQLRGILGIDELFEGAVLEELLLNLWMLIIIFVHKTSQNSIVVNAFLDDEVEFVCHGIKPALFQLFVYEVV